MPFRSRFSRPRKFSRRPRRVIRRRPKVSRKIKTYVKRAIHRNIENKERIDYGANQSVVTNTTSSQTKSLFCACGQGTDETSRTGNQIKVVKGVMDLTINLMPYNASTNPNPSPVWVRVMVVRDLQQAGQNSSFSAAQLTKLFKGNATTLGFQNNTLDMLLDVNKDWYRPLYDKTFKLGSSFLYSAGGVSSASIFDNSPAAKHLKIYWSKWAKKQLKFDDNVSPYLPINENLYFIIQAVPAQGQSNSAGDSLIEFHYVNTMAYEDA